MTREKIEFNKIIGCYTHYITDENQNKWKVVEVSDIEEICQVYHQMKLKEQQ